MSNKSVKNIDGYLWEAKAKVMEATYDYQKNLNINRRSWFNNKPQGWATEIFANSLHEIFDNFKIQILSGKND